jgi:hypothetical protein
MCCPDIEQIGPVTTSPLPPPPPDKHPHNAKEKSTPTVKKTEKKNTPKKKNIKPHPSTTPVFLRSSHHKVLLSMPLVIGHDEIIQILLLLVRQGFLSGHMILAPL